MVKTDSSTTSFQDLADKLRRTEELLEATRTDRDASLQRFNATQEHLRIAQKRILELESLLTRLFHSRMFHVEQKRAMERPLPLFEQGVLDGMEESLPAPSDQPADGNEPIDPEASLDQIRNRKRPKKPRGRKGLPADLPRISKEYPVDLSLLPDCDETKGHRVLRNDESEELHFEPAQLYVVVHCRPVVLYTTTAGDSCVVTFGDQGKVFDKCMASPSLLAKIAMDKFDRDLTLYRIERWFREELHCPLSRATLCSWLIRLGLLLEPIQAAQEAELMRGFKIHADDTEVKILAPSTGSTDVLRVWVRIGGAEGRMEIVFTFSERRDGPSVGKIFGGFGGFLQVDACSVYLRLYEDGKCIEVGCWSHVFRKFDEIEEFDGRVRPMLSMIRRLYDVEAVGAALHPDERRILRLIESRPILEEIRRWVEEQRRDEVLESSFKKALNYVHNHWAALTRYLDDGRLSIDNNISEGMFHVFGVLRRNCLFFGSREGLQAGLVIFGLIQTCRYHGIDPHVYLEDVIKRLTAGTATPDQLTPPAWKALVAQESKPVQS